MNLQLLDSFVFLIKIDIQSGYFTIKMIKRLYLTKPS